MTCEDIFCLGFKEAFNCAPQLDISFLNEEMTSDFYIGYKNGRIFLEIFLENNLDTSQNISVDIYNFKISFGEDKVLSMYFDDLSKKYTELALKTTRLSDKYFEV